MQIKEIFRKIVELETERDEVIAEQIKGKQSANKIYEAHKSAFRSVKQLLLELEESENS